MAVQRPRWATAALAAIVIVAVIGIFAVPRSSGSPHQEARLSDPWNDTPQNLQVLPKDWPGRRLRPPMMGFCSALGVGCDHCHVGEAGAALSTYDFASDENPNKDRAREMLRMLESINGHLDKIEPSGDRRVNMWCHTCHRGRPRPMTLGEELGEVTRRDGIASALEHYDALEKEFSARGSYDFGEGSLNSFGYSLLREKDATGAIAVFRRNAEKFPESGNVWDSLAEAYLESGDRARAREYYGKSLELDPGNRNAQEKLEELGGSGQSGE